MAARSTDLLRVTGILVRDGLGDGRGIAFDLVQPEVHAFQAETYAHEIDDRLAPRRDALIQLFGAFIVIGGFLDLVLLRGQSAHIARIPPEAVGAVAVAIGE